MFGGFSAGAVGAMYHLDNVAETLKKYGVRTLGYLDSPLYFDIDTKNESLPGLVNFVKKGVEVHKPSATLAS